MDDQRTDRESGRVSADSLLLILGIGHDVSMRGEGISLHEAIRRSDYATLRSHFSARDLVPLIQEHPELVLQWTMYSEDKRTDGGFAVTDDSVEGIAEYAVRELDFRAMLQDKKK